jgi:hypothetical protein
VACAVGPSVTTSSTDFPFQSLIFWNLFEFSAAKKSFNIQELLHHKSKHHGTTKLTHPSSSRAFQRHQEHDLKHPGSVDLITLQSKTNYLPS